MRYHHPHWDLIFCPEALRDGSPWQLCCRLLTGVWLPVCTVSLLRLEHLWCVRSRQRLNMWHATLSAVRNDDVAVTVGWWRSIFFFLGVTAGYKSTFKMHAATYCLSDVPCMDVSMLYRLCLHRPHILNTMRAREPPKVVCQMWSHSSLKRLLTCLQIASTCMFFPLILIAYRDTDGTLIPGTVKNWTMYFSYFHQSVKMTMQLNPKCSFWTQSWTRHLSTNFIWSFFNLCVQEENINFDTSFLVVYSQRKCVHFCDLWTI